MSFFHQTKQNEATEKCSGPLLCAPSLIFSHRTRLCPRHCAVGTHNFGLVSRTIIIWVILFNAKFELRKCVRIRISLLFAVRGA